MRFKVLLFVGFLVSFSFGQEVNRASEWKIKRPEQSAEQVEKQMSLNGTVAVKGKDPARLDLDGDPISTKPMQSEKVGFMQREDENAVRQQSERLIQSSFDVAGNSVAAEEKPKANPVFVGGICLFIGGLLVIAFRMFTKRIAVPEDQFIS